MASLASSGGVPGPLAILIGVAVGTAWRVPERVPGHPDQPATVHRHPGDAEHLPGGRAALLRRFEHPVDGAAELGQLRRERPPHRSAEHHVGRHHRRDHGDRRGLRPEPDHLGSPRVRGGQRCRGRAAGRHPREPRAAGVYTVAGLLYGITAWLQIGRAGSASPNALTDANLESITAVVIGGTSLFGGRGAVIGTIIGALIVYAFRLPGRGCVLATGALAIAAVQLFDQCVSRKVKA